MWYFFQDNLTIVFLISSICSFSTFIFYMYRHTNGSTCITKCPTAQRIKIQLINPTTLFSQLSSIFPDSQTALNTFSNVFFDFGLIIAAATLENS
jgi:hypothetical protein